MYFVCLTIIFSHAITSFRDLHEIRDDMTEEGKTEPNTSEIMQMAVDIVSAYVGNNIVLPANIPDVINSVYGTLSSLNGAGNGAGDANHHLRPAVPIKKSITPDYIVCLEDGKKTENVKTPLAHDL